MEDRAYLQLNQVKQNNEKINNLFEQILKIRRKQRISIEKNGVIDSQVNELLLREVKKCLEIYKLEFSNYDCQGKDTVSFRQAKTTADCYGGTDGLQITFGMQKFIDEMILPTIKKMGYEIDENGEPAFDETFKNNTEHNYNYKVSSFRKYVGSTKDQMDYFALLLAKNGVDLDFIWDALAHEEMHTFGVNSGNVFMKEGTTEELTREVCQKYNIHMSPHAHTQEANFVRKLEILVGREEVIEAGMWTGKFKETRFASLLRENPELTYSDLSEKFELLKSDPQKLEDKETETLNKFCETYPNIAIDLKEIVVDYRKKENTRYFKIAEKFDSELGMESGSFLIYLDILENMYSLSQNYKKDPKLYRDIYNKPLDELRNGYVVFETGKGFNNKDIEVLDNIRISFNKLSEMNPQLKINSFNDLMAPINEKIADRELTTNNDPKDYSMLLSIQEEELNKLQETLDKMLLEQDKNESQLGNVNDEVYEKNNIHSITGKELGKGIFRDFTQNPREAIKAIEAIENGVKALKKEENTKEEGLK